MSSFIAPLRNHEDISVRPATNLAPSTSRTTVVAQDVIPSNPLMNDVQAAFSAVNIQGIRRYYTCGDPPTQLTGIGESHFKGVAAYGNKLIFTHTDLDTLSPASNGRYLIGDVISSGDQGNIDVDLYTQHPGWCHPCGIQACGSFMAMGIQQSASGDGAKVSEIQIFDIRNALADQPIVLLGAISRPSDGVNGVAMTREAGDDGRYIVAAVNGNTLTVYRSQSSSLLTPGSAAFDPIPLQDPAYSFPDSGAGLGLITQVDGNIFLISMNANDDGSNSLIGLYRLEVSAKQATCTQLATTAIPIPGVSDSVSLLEEYAAVISWPALFALLAKGEEYLNSSFRWGRGLKITSANTFEVYATDRNVLPLSKIPVVGSPKDFSIVVWASENAPPGISAPLGDVCVGDDRRPYCFLLGTDGHLWQRYFGDGQWHWFDTGMPPASAGNIVAGIGTLTTADQRPYIFLKCADGHLWQNYWNNNQWNWYDAGRPGPNVTVNQSVGALLVGDDERPYVFMTGTNGHLLQNYWGNNQWNWYDAGTPTQSVYVSTGVGVCMTGDQRPYAFIIGSDGHLWQNYWGNNQWNWNDLGVPGTDVTVSHPVGALSVGVGNDMRPYAFVIGSDGHLRQNYWGNNQWNWFDAGTPTSSVTVSTGVGVLTTSDQRPYAFVIGSDGHLWQNYWGNNQWNWFDAGMPSAGISQSVGVTTLGGDQRPLAFVLGGDGHLWANFWTGDKWTWLDLGA